MSLLFVKKEHKSTHTLAHVCFGEMPFTLATVCDNVGEPRQYLVKCWKKSVLRAYYKAPPGLSQRNQTLRQRMMRRLRERMTNARRYVAASVHGVRFVCAALVVMSELRAAVGLGGAMLCLSCSPELKTV